MYAVAKLVIALVSPLGTCLALALTGGVLLLLRCRRTGRACITVGLLWLLAWSLPSVSFWLARSLERQTPQHLAAEYPMADTIILLGGGLQGRVPGWVDRPEMTTVADRLWFADELYRAGRAPRIIISAGSDPRGGEIEADAMAQLLEALGVPRAALLIDARSRDTAQNARYSSDLMREGRLHTALLVTSALHMPRALATFRKHGVDVTPAPADFTAPPVGAWPQRWLPSTSALDVSSRALKEYVGLWAYRLRGQA